MIVLPELTKKAMESASPITGWHPYPVFCGERLIASAPTKELRDSMIRQRQSQYPESRYGILPVCP